MNPKKVEQALKLLEQAQLLLKDQTNNNLKKSQSYLRETIRCLKDLPG